MADCNGGLAPRRPVSTGSDLSEPPAYYELVGHLRHRAGELTDLAARFDVARRVNTSTHLLLDLWQASTSVSVTRGGVRTTMGRGSRRWTSTRRRWDRSATETVERSSQATVTVRDAPLGTILVETGWATPRRLTRTTARSW